MTFCRGRSSSSRASLRIASVTTTLLQTPMNRMTCLTKATTGQSRKKRQRNLMLYAVTRLSVPLLADSSSLQKKAARSGEASDDDRGKKKGSSKTNGKPKKR